MILAGIVLCVKVLLSKNRLKSKMKCIFSDYYECRNTFVYLVYTKLVFFSIKIYEM